MESTSTHEGTQGAKRQHTKQFDIRKFMFDLAQNDPNMTQDQAIIELTHHARECFIAGDEAPFRAACDSAGANNWTAVQRQPRRRPTPVDPQDVEAVKTAIAVNYLLKCILPSGRSLYDSTREEIMEYDGNLTGLIAKLSPGQTPRQAGITNFD
jgi:hypothetical protein